MRIVFLSYPTPCYGNELFLQVSRSLLLRCGSSYQFNTIRIQESCSPTPLAGCTGTGLGPLHSRPRGRFAGAGELASEYLHSCLWIFLFTWILPIAVILHTSEPFLFTILHKPYFQDIINNKTRLLLACDCIVGNEVYSVAEYFGCCSGSKQQE